jgi:hypothetical protein
MFQLLGMASCVAFANILLNLFASKAASEAHTFFAVFRSGSFFIAFFVGITSLLLMCSLYFVGRSNLFGMANGVLLMGAISIVGGTLVGFFFRGSDVHWSEWVLMSLILIFVGVRYGIGTGLVR